MVLALQGWALSVVPTPAGTSNPQQTRLRSERHRPVGADTEVYHGPPHKPAFVLLLTG